MDLKKIIDFLIEKNITFEQLVLLLTLYKEQQIGKPSEMFSLLFNYYEKKPHAVDLNLITLKIVIDLIKQDYLLPLTLEQKGILNTNVFGKSYKVLKLGDKGKALVEEIIKEKASNITATVRDFWNYSKIGIGGKTSNIETITYNLSVFKSKYSYDDTTIIEACKFYVNEFLLSDNELKYITPCDKFISDKLEQYCEIVMNNKNINKSSSTTLI